MSSGEVPFSQRRKANEKAFSVIKKIGKVNLVKQRKGLLEVLCFFFFLTQFLKLKVFSFLIFEKLLNFQFTFFFFNKYCHLKTINICCQVQRKLGGILITILPLESYANQMTSICLSFPHWQNEAMRPHNHPCSMKWRCICIS